jgi:hypothetical protein
MRICFLRTDGQGEAVDLDGSSPVLLVPGLPAQGYALKRCTAVLSVAAITFPLP